MSHINKILSILALAAFLSCAPDPVNYLNSALDIMEENSIYKDRIDWPVVRSGFIQKAKGANTVEEIYPLVKEAIYTLRDGHSLFLTSEEKSQLFDENQRLPQIKGEILKGQIAYLQIPGFIGSENNANKFALSIIKEIELLDSQNPSSWIVDLTLNTGGNMWPMFLGLSPLLGEGTHGYFHYPNTNIVPWKYINDKVYAGDKIILTLARPYRISDRAKTKIAVLIGRNTASSGEATAILFKGLDNAKLIGEFTAGLTTSNEGFDLEDGATIYLTTSYFSDRNKLIYGSSIEPDIYSTKPLDRAIKWLNKG